MHQSVFSRFRAFLFVLVVASPFSYAQVRVAPSPGAQGRLPYSDPYANEPPYPYDLTYSFQTDDGGSSHAQEVGDQYNTKRGSYGYTGPDGIYRQVDYIADADGFRATIRSNEPGMTGHSPPASVVYDHHSRDPAISRPPVVRPPVRPVVAVSPGLAAAPFPAPIAISGNRLAGELPIPIARPIPVAPVARRLYSPVPVAAAPIPIVRGAQPFIHPPFAHP